jgi:hypothetical protein
MAATAAICHLGFGFHQLSNDWSDWSDIFVAHWGSSIFTIFHFSLNLIIHVPTDNVPPRGICYALRRPCFQSFSTNIILSRSICFC